MNFRDYLQPLSRPINRLIRTDRLVVRATRPGLRGLEELADKLIWSTPLVIGPDDTLKQYLLARIRLDDRPVT